jgi:hypothetical protein
MSDNAYSVRVVFDPYSHADVNSLLVSVFREYGPRSKDRWTWAVDDTDTAKNFPHRWSMQFSFKDPHDATMFALKYSR